MKNFLVAVTVAAVFAALYMLLSGTEELQEGQVMHSGTLQVSNKRSYIHDVVFPQTFAEQPQVAVKLIKGNGSPEILETRLDGFSFIVKDLGYSEVEGAHVEWKATGFVNEQ